MKSIDITSDSYAEYNEDSNKKDAKGYAPNWSDEVSKIFNKIKNTVPWTYAIIDVNGEEITGSFYEKELQKLVKKNLEQKKYLKEKVINCMSNEKGIIIVLIV